MGACLSSSLVKLVRLLLRTTFSPWGRPTCLLAVADVGFQVGVRSWKRGAVGVLDPNPTHQTKTAPPSIGHPQGPPIGRRRRTVGLLLQVRSRTHYDLVTNNNLGYGLSVAVNRHVGSGPNEGGGESGGLTPPPNVQRTLAF